MKNLFCVLEFSFLKSLVPNNNFRNSYNSITLILTSLSLFILFFLSCNTTEPPDDKPPVEPDSTTQNFTFETFEFGDGFESSWLNDVWIFDENNIWAVGYLAPSDTTISGVHITNPNIIRWDGSSWKLQPFSGTSSGMEGIWALDSSHIYFASGGLRKYVNGVYSTINTNLGLQSFQGIYKLWGSSESNIWGVGPGGTIVHYDGTAWSKIDFDINYRFDAITGSKQTGIAYASATSPEFNTIIVELKDNSATTIYNSANNSESLTSFTIKQLNEQELILGTNSVWTFNVNTKETKILYKIGTIGNYITLSALNSPIDVYFFIDKYGDGEDLLHYNGKRFSTTNFSSRNHVIYGGAYAIKDLAVMTGFSNNKGYLVKVKRIN